jgi:hypothetical protein
MTDCTNGPHTCYKRWTCSHGREFPRHEPDGHYRASNRGPAPCPDCQTECEKAGAKLAGSGVVDHLNEALRRSRGKEGA